MTLVVLIVDFLYWSTRPSSPHLSSSSQLMIQNQQVRPAVIITHVLCVLITFVLCLGYLTGMWLQKITCVIWSASVVPTINIIITIDILLIFARFLIDYL